jgi:hypothetical protein
MVYRGYMQNTNAQQSGNGFPFQNKKTGNTNTTVSFSVVGKNGGHVPTHVQQPFQRLNQLLKENVERLEKTLHRHEAYSLKPFPKYMNQKEVIAYLGHDKIFWILVNEYGLKPIRQEHRLNIYCSKQVDEKCVMLDLNIAA